MNRLLTRVVFAGTLTIILGVWAMSQEKKEAAVAKARETITASGLKYVDLVVGKGDAAGKGDTVLVHYTGWLFNNGKRADKFDSSVGREPFPVTIGVTGVIAGWTEGLQGMQVGARRQLVIPPKLGYGERGFPGAIPPNSTLEFEVELLKLSR